MRVPLSEVQPRNALLPMDTMVLGKVRAPERLEHPWKAEAPMEDNVLES